VVLREGRPVERHEIATPGDFSRLSDEELMVQLEATVKSLRSGGSLSD